MREVFFSSCSVPESLAEYHTTLKRFSQNLSSTRSNVAADNGGVLNEASNQQLASVNLPIGDAFEFAGKRTAGVTAVLPLGAEYAALLSVCAIKTWIAPHLLAEVNTNFEVAPFLLRYS